MARPKKLKVEYAKLYGFSDSEARKVWIDERQSDRDLLDTAAHEATHIVFPEATEVQCEQLGAIVAHIAYDKLGFRRPKKKAK